MRPAIPVRNPRSGEVDFSLEPLDRDDVAREHTHVVELGRIAGD